MSDAEPNVSVFHVSSEVLLTPSIPLPFHIIAPSCPAFSYDNKTCRIRFEEPGTYRFVFEGEIKSLGFEERHTIVFDLTGVEHQYCKLLEKSLPLKGVVSRSIIMPCNRKDKLKIHFLNAGGVTIKADAQLQIYKL